METCGNLERQRGRNGVLIKVCDDSGETARHRTSIGPTTADFADFADWTPGSRKELPRWTSNEGFYASPEPVPAMLALMDVRQTNYQDPPSSQLSPPKSLAAGATVARAGRFDLLRHVVANWKIRFPYEEQLAVRDALEEAVALSSAEPVEGALALAGSSEFTR
ncbi:hypothetical protein [Streptomyces griseocarneus]|uniref:hypothetical protein n=1 Tax=Streptomyces griseocarneus TaxID=51201 RepID=UPI00167CB7CB|nr:hypothetical protein [Streptomyces griseocarneus]MBZ6475395.1 hypothetical protein [Streptomyces griseocarneus]GHG75047.1 hypothetical protein GCM10018779_52240 [Streptomyces griseocarneus]